MKKIASCSFGKDSLAAIIVSEENGIHIDKAVYCRIMFDNSISAEPPEHEAFIHEVAIPTLEKRYGIKTTIVQAKETYCDRFFAKYEHGGKIGQIYGFPMRRGEWCNSNLKMKPQELSEKRFKGKCFRWSSLELRKRRRSIYAAAPGYCRPLTGAAGTGWGAGFAIIRESQNYGDCEKNTLNYGKS